MGATSRAKLLLYSLPVVIVINLAMNILVERIAASHALGALLSE